MAVDIRQQGKQLVKRTKIIGTSALMYSAWERDESPLLESPYRSLSHVGGERYGKIGSDSHTRAKEARTLIETLFPESAHGRWDESIYEVMDYD